MCFFCRVYRSPILLGTLRSWDLSQWSSTEPYLWSLSHQQKKEEAFISSWQRVCGDSKTLYAKSSYTSSYFFWWTRGQCSWRAALPTSHNPLYARVNAKLRWVLWVLWVNISSFFRFFFLVVRVKMKQWQECVFVKLCVYVCATGKRDFGGKAINVANWFSSLCSDSWCVDRVSFKQNIRYHYQLLYLSFKFLILGRKEQLEKMARSEEEFLNCHCTCYAVFLHWRESTTSLTKKMKPTFKM